MGYRVWFNLDDGSSEDFLEELFDSEEEAEDAALEYASNYESGRDILIDSGRDYCESKIIDWEIMEE